MALSPGLLIRLRSQVQVLAGPHPIPQVRPGSPPGLTASRGTAAALAPRWGRTPSRYRPKGIPARATHHPGRGRPHAPADLRAACHRWANLRACLPTGDPRAQPAALRRPGSQTSHRQRVSRGDGRAPVADTVGPRRSDLSDPCSCPPHPRAPPTRRRGQRGHGHETHRCQTHAPDTGRRTPDTGHWTPDGRTGRRTLDRHRRRTLDGWTLDTPTLTEDADRVTTARWVSGRLGHHDPGCGRRMWRLGALLSLDDWGRG
jgi:hypothetical protein